MNKKQESFELAFSMDTSGGTHECICGKVYYDYAGFWEWEEGELEELEKNPNVLAVNHAIGLLQFEGKIYVSDCECWHERVNALMGFIDSHSHQIAKYLNSERDRKIEEAQSMPVLKTDS